MPRSVLFAITSGGGTKACVDAAITRVGRGGSLIPASGETGQQYDALYLTEADVERLLDIPLAIQAVEAAFKRLADGEAQNVPRTRARSPGIVLHTMSAAAAYVNLVGWKCYTTTSGGGGKFLVGLYDALTGNLVALIEADRLGQLRTAATTGVAVQWMAQPDATEVGLIGTGWQARGQLAAVAAVRPIQVAYVYGRNEERRQRFTDEMCGELGIEVRAVDRPHEAVEDLRSSSRQPTAVNRYCTACGWPNRR